MEKNMQLEQRNNEVVVWVYASEQFHKVFTRERPDLLRQFKLHGLKGMSLLRSQSGIWYMRFRFGSVEQAELARTERILPRSVLDLEAVLRAQQFPFFEPLPEGSYCLVTDDDADLQPTLVVSFVPLDGFEAFIVGIWRSLTRDLARRIGTPVTLRLYLRHDGRLGYFTLACEGHHEVSVMKTALDATLADHQLNVVMAREKAVDTLPRAVLTWEGLPDTV